MGIILSSSGLPTHHGVFTYGTPPSPVFWNNTQYTQTSANGIILTLNSNAASFTTYPVYGNKQISTPTYFEILVNRSAPAANTPAVGVSALGGSDTSGTNVFQWHGDGTLWTDGGFENDGSWATWGSGDTLCFAVDPNNNMIWGRVNAGGQWNNSGTADPATDAGGKAIPTAIVTAGIVAGGILYLDDTTFQANFTSDSFIGTPPSGFSPLSP